ncbi:MAG: PEGA domain-containing protein [Deltaproteobacteria bacterium]|nr:PEGA domain-containing protein [Deltaproteobacteria bacterium]
MIGRASPAAAPVIVERLGPPRRPIWDDTGELMLPDETSLDDSGIFRIQPLLTDPSLTLAGEPDDRRLRSSHERWLSVAVCALLLCTAFTFFSPAIKRAVLYLLRGEEVDVWRETELRIDSLPAGASVFIEDRHRGRTPLTLSDRCRGRRIRVRLERNGFDIWQWSGICPATGRMKIEARLLQAAAASTQPVPTSPAPSSQGAAQRGE